MPVIAASRAVPHQFDLFEGAGRVSGEVRRQRHANRLQAAGARQQQFLTMRPDARVLPRGRAVALASMGITHLPAHLPLLARYLAGVIEALLRGITTMGMQCGATAE